MLYPNEFFSFSISIGKNLAQRLQDLIINERPSPVEDYIDSNTERSIKHRSRILQADAKTNAIYEQTVENARKLTETALKAQKISKNARLRGINDNTRLEQNIERQNTIFNLSEEKKVNDAAVGNQHSQPASPAFEEQTYIPPASSLQKIKESRKRRFNQDD